MIIQHIGEVLSSIDFWFFFALVAGCTAGYIFGALPGFTATMGVALFVPFSYGMSTSTALAFLIALYCSAVYAGSIPAILIRTPGTPAAVATTYDGYAMARRGEAGRALGLACLASVLGGLLSALILCFTAEPVARLALKFGPHEYFALGIMGLSMVIGMASDHMLKGFAAASFGLLVTTIGMDATVGIPRFTFGNIHLLSGIGELPVMIGTFAIAEVLYGLDVSGKQVQVDQNVKGLFSGVKDILKNWWLIIKSSVIGTFLGALPGVGGPTAAMVCYNTAKQSSKNPELMGTGQPEGIIGPESANNAVTGGALIPMLALGIPGDSVTAILLGALMIKGIQPGPELFTKHPEVALSVYITIILAYLVILALASVSIKTFAKMLKVPQPVLFGLVLICCMVGVYAVQNSYFDMILALVFGVIGYFMRRHGLDLGPFILAYVLGTMIEKKLGIAMQISHNNYLSFFTRPISGILLGVTIVFVAISVIKLKKKNTGKQNSTERQ